MSFVPSPNEDDLFTALRNFLLTIVPAGVEVFRGQNTDTVPEPQGEDFVVLTPTLRRRLSTNQDSYLDTAFLGSVSGTTLTIASMNQNFAPILVGRMLLGTGVVDGTTITALETGTGGVGTYTVSQEQTVAQAVLATGIAQLVQPTEITIQVDVHGPNGGDTVEAISTVLRDDYATLWFYRAGWSALGIEPLYADDPRQMPFINAEQNYEDRWTLDAKFQVNQAVTPAQQFVDVITIQPMSVEAFSRSQDIA